MKRFFLAALGGFLSASSLHASVADSTALQQAAKPQPLSWNDGTPQPTERTHIRAQQPAGLEMKLTLPKSHFFQGEEIPATLLFSNQSAKPYHTWIGTYDRSGRITNIGFYAVGQHGDEVTDPLGWYSHRALGMGGGIGNWTDLGTWKAALPVNEWLRFDHPGVYHLWAWSQRVQPGLHSETGPETAPPIALVSDEVTITIDPLTPADEQAVLAQAGKILGQHEVNFFAPFFPSPDSITQLTKLRFLATPAAVQALLPYLGQGNNDAGRCAAYALLGSPDPKAQAAVLLAGVKQGKPLLNSFVVDVYAGLKTYGSNMPLGMVLYKDGKLLTSPNDPEQLARQEITRAAQNAGGDPTIAASACWAAFQAHPQDPAVRQALAAHQLDLTHDQRFALVNQWRGEIETVHERIRDPATQKVIDDMRYGGADFLPVVRKTAEAPEYNPYALQILASMAPDEAKPLIIADIKRGQSLYLSQAKTHFPTPVGLDAMPVQPIPELTTTFRRRLLDSTEDPDLLMPLVDRYGTDDLLPDVKHYYEPQIGDLSCYAEGACLRFWIRHEPKAGMNALQKALHSRENTRCYTMLFDYVLKDQWNDLAEPMVVKDLGDADPDFVLTALKVLEENGSANSVEPAIAALDRIHSTVPPKIENEESLSTQRWQQGSLARDLLENSRWTYTPGQKARLQKIAATTN